MLKFADHKIGRETHDRAEAASEALPETMAEGMAALLDQQRHYYRRSIMGSSGFDLTTLQRRLASIAKLRGQVQAIAKEDTRRVQLPAPLDADTKAVHLAEVLTPQGWRTTVRAAIARIRDGYFDEFELAALGEAPKGETQKRRGRPPKQAPAPAADSAPRSSEEIQSDLIIIDKLLTDMDTVEAKGRTARDLAARVAMGGFR